MSNYAVGKLRETESPLKKGERKKEVKIICQTEIKGGKVKVYDRVFMDGRCVEVAENKTTHELKLFI